MYDPRDERGVPTSTGIPPIVRISAIVGVLIIFCIIGIVLFASNFGHAWPYTNAVKVPL
jgi:hypothetical protein